MINFLKWLPALATALAMLLAQRSLMHDFQLESYQFPGYFRTLRRNWKRALLPGVTLAAYLTLLYLAYRSVDRMLDMSVGKILLALVNAALAVAGGWWCRSIFQQKKAKKPFVVTMRVKRTYIVMGVVYTLLCTPIALLTKVYFCGLLPLLLPLWVALGGLLAWPIEKLVSEMYFRDAQKKLAARPDIIKIGITGSYGKTSVKFILGTILQEKYQTLITPSSFNTPMGVTKIIRERLTPATQVFVAEMGARHVGDIKELCRLVHPRYGVLTSVGPQHLDTFHTLERIKNTKYELMDAVPADGCCFFPVNIRHKLLPYLFNTPDHQKSEQQSKKDIVAGKIPHSPAECQVKRNLGNQCKQKKPSRIFCPAACMVKSLYQKKTVNRKRQSSNNAHQKCGIFQSRNLF